MSESYHRRLGGFWVGRRGDDPLRRPRENPDGLGWNDGRTAFLASLLCLPLEHSGFRRLAIFLKADAQLPQKVSHHLTVIWDL